MKEIKPRYEVRDGKIYDKGFEVVLPIDSVCNMLNELHNKHGAPIYEIEDEEDYEPPAPPWYSEDCV
jgi:hypothetical protein